MVLVKQRIIKTIFEHEFINKKMKRYGEDNYWKSFDSDKDWEDKGNQIRKRLEQSKNNYILTFSESEWGQELNIWKVIHKP